MKIKDLRKQIALGVVRVQVIIKDGKQVDNSGPNRKERRHPTDYAHCAGMSKNV